MIDFKDYPTKEDFLETISRCAAQCREALSDIEYVGRKYISGDWFMTEEEVAELLRCPVESIPKMPCYKSHDRRDNNKWKRLYKRSDVNDYLETRKMNH